MKNFEMPKMNISVFSVENIVTGSGITPPAKTNLEVAQEALTGVGSVTTVSTAAAEWIDA